MQLVLVLVLSLLGLGWGMDILKFARNVEALSKASEEGAGPPLVVLVTGASSGIGKAIALEFARHGTYKVWATMRDPSKWDGDENDKVGLLRVGALDVTSDESVDALVRRVVEEDGGVDIVVNNAGYGVSGCLEMVRLSEAQALFEVNVWGVVRVLQAVLPHMRRARRGHIINISSTSGIRGIPCFEFYTSSKFALEGLTDSMRYSLAPFNISITNVNAGPVVTAFSDRFGNAQAGGKGTRDPDDATGYLEALNQVMIDSLAARMASPEAQTAEQVAQVVHHLAEIKFRLGRGRPTDVPFNIGTSPQSHQVLEDVRINPTGWGGVYNKLLAFVPPLEADSGAAATTPKEEL